jgi:hypothetical protein
LNQGGFNQNNSSLSYYDFDSKSLNPDIFKSVNGRILGDVANDVKVYGSKMYIVVNVSSTVEVIDFKTSKSIKQINLKNAQNVAMQPRSIIFNKNKAFISCFDGTVAVLDTASLNIEKNITVGNNPEQMAIANNKLYVANSGGLNYPNYDKTVSVIDLNSLIEIMKIPVTDNPTEVAADQYGDVYVKSSGNYNDIKPALTIIDSKTNLIKTKLDNFSGTNMIIVGDNAYFTTNHGASIFNVKTETVQKEQFISDGTSITSPYGISVNNLTGEVFITDAKDYASRGEVFCFDQNGKKNYSVITGLLPSTVIFTNK